MAVLESCPKHNMVAYLEKTDGNNRVFMRLSAFLREAPFTMLSLYITAKVASKPVSISKASIRSDLLFDDADGIDSLPNQAIFDAIQLNLGPSTNSHITESILEGSSGIMEVRSIQYKIPSGNEGGMTLPKLLCEHCNLLVLHSYRSAKKINTEGTYQEA
ncbi:hypothetical protein Tco_0267908 [Tanacetum coccineum]